MPTVTSGRRDAPLGRLALSTMYFQRWRDQSDLRPFFEAGTEMGFDRFELSHILSPAAVSSVAPGEARIAAIHHPCPLAPGHRAAQRLTSADPEAREDAARQIGVTIETAARLGAPVVVLHLGYLEDEAGDPLRRARFEVESRYLAGQSSHPAYRQARSSLVALLDAMEPAHLERALAALPPVLDMAARHGVRIGVETGYHIHELPRPIGMRQLLERTAGSPLGAWLDTGHVFAQQNLGLHSIEDWLGVVGDRWLGAHLHDVVGLRDHLIPGTGAVPFAELGPRLPEDAVRTCEFDWYFAPEEVVSGAHLLVRSGCA